MGARHRELAEAGAGAPRAERDKKLSQVRSSSAAEERVKQKKEEDELNKEVDARWQKVVLPTQATAVQANGSAPSKKRKFKGPKQGAQATRRHVRLRVDEGGCAACHVALAAAAEAGITKGRHTYCEAHGIELLGAKRPRKSQAKPKTK